MQHKPKVKNPAHRPRVMSWRYCNAIDDAGFSMVGRKVQLVSDPALSCTLERAQGFDKPKLFDDLEWIVPDLVEVT